MITSLKYPAYKDSGVEWLGQVPAHWEVLPGRAVFREINDRGHPDEQMLSVTITRGVLRQADLLADSSKKDSSNEDKSNYKLVQPGDLVYNKMRAWQGAVGVSAYRGIVSPAYIVQRLRSAENLPRYMHFLLRTPLFASEAERWSYGITSDQWSLRAEEFKCIYFSLPPLPEQTAIVRFLDWADRRIRRVIRARQRRIKLLEEYKQALIHQAVTGRIDVRTGQPYPAYKDSGVEWLGEVPAHWEVRRIKTIARIRYGLGQPPKEMDGGIPMLRATNVSRGTICEKDLLRVDPSDVPLNRGAFLHAGEIIVVRSGAFTADSAIVPEAYEGAVAGYDMVVTALKISPRFLALVLLTPYVRDDQLTIASMRSAQPHLNAEELGAALVAVPPLPEQTAIVEYLDAQTAKVDAAIAAARREIELLREYRERLIADVVTGKVDVRKVAAQLPEESEEPDLPEEEVDPLTDESEEVNETMSADEETED
ncbi:MAG: restriction endonuclease subunit S [Acidobacterium ailaaui]|nr:restriction endonuclease subunit S [Pseudacidobacterium ailaaui]